ncbi:hypothetical protein AB0H34_30915 [Saccharopolyspora shandongensis]|uniref:hypothetical protein n=1 Tax=Saccharopolyspora shandongensis TaxID=418495 RepID=UPI003410764B
MDWLRQCAAWLTQLDADRYPPVVNLRPIADWPATCNRAVDLARVAAVLERIAANVDELARARRVENLDGAAVRGDARAERRRRLAEPDLDFHTFCETTTLPTSSTGKPGRPSGTAGAKPSIRRISGTPRSVPAEHAPFFTAQTARFIDLCSERACTKSAVNRLRESVNRRGDRDSPEGMHGPTQGRSSEVRKTLVKLELAFR